MKMLGITEMITENVQDLREQELQKSKRFRYVQIVNIQAASRIAEIGVLVGNPLDQNQGYGQEAMRMAVDFSWRSLNLQRLSLWVIGDNPRAVHVYGKAGFQVEGVMLRAAYVDGRYQDVTVMGVLRSGD